MRKILSSFLILALLCATLCNVLAVASAEFQFSSIEAQAGETVNVNISIVNNPGIASVKLKVQYSDDLILNSIVYNTALGGQSQQPQTLTSPVTLNWYNGAANTEGDMVYATLSFTVKENAAPGDKLITATFNPNDIFNSDLDNVDFTVIDGKITVSEVLEEIEGDVTIDRDTDSDTAYIPNIALGTTAEELLSKFTNENCVITDKKGNPISGKLGTGCVVKLVINGVLHDSAIIIVNADLDGDAMVTSKDVILAKMYRQSQIGGNIAKLASDLDGNGSVSSNDIKSMALAVAKN